MDYIYDTFTFKGRLTRRRFFAIILAVHLTYYFVVLSISLIFAHSQFVLVSMLFVITFNLWANLTLLARRLQDFNAPTYLIIVPILLSVFQNTICQILSILCILLIGLIPGTQGPNTYGEDPRLLTQ